MASWVDSIREFAKQNGGKFTIPRRGTEDYDKVRALQQSMSTPVIEEKPKRKPRAPKTENAPTEKKVIAVAPPEVSKVVAPVGEKVANPPTEKKVTVAVPVEKVPRKKKSEVLVEAEVQAKAKRTPKSKALKATIVNETVNMTFP